MLDCVCVCVCVHLVCAREKEEEEEKVTRRVQLRVTTCDAAHIACTI